MFEHVQGGVALYRMIRARDHCNLLYWLAEMTYPLPNAAVSTFTRSAVHSNGWLQLSNDRHQLTPRCRVIDSNYPSTALSRLSVLPKPLIICCGLVTTVVKCNAFFQPNFQNIIRLTSHNIRIIGSAWFRLYLFISNYHSCARCNAVRELFVEDVKYSTTGWNISTSKPQSDCQGCKY